MFNVLHEAGWFNGTCVGKRGLHALCRSPFECRIYGEEKCAISSLDMKDGWEEECQ